MKIQCELCKEIVPIGPFATSGAGIEVTCQACGGSFFVPAASAPSETETSLGVAEPAGGEPRMRCPKCDTDQPRAAACRACGLRADRFDAMAEGSLPAPPMLEQAWADCEAAWGDAERHRVLLERTAGARSFAWTARRYRQRLREQPGDTTAAEQLERLTRMAEAELLSLTAARVGSSEGEAPYKNVLLVMIALLLVAGIGGIYVLMKRASAQEREPPSESSSGRPPMGPAPAPAPTGSGSPGSR